MDLLDLTTILFALWGVGVLTMLVCLILWADRISPSVSNEMVETRELLERLRKLNEEDQNRAEGGPK
ncbi:hypothetical protein UFOVP730_44 [uncultured Caudovirales phage]|uniref:Uncharacterized protein n=1 Tax=uncultured Caudovirales phage TaxID=2100421 RepID=A0A6J5NQT3_9CAUD|nr:hypothetical protein UFOVP730_44 [uncultured Caudovirales phage]